MINLKSEKTVYCNHSVNVIISVDLSQRTLTVLIRCNDQIKFVDDP